MLFNADGSLSCWLCVNRPLFLCPSVWMVTFPPVGPFSVLPYKRFPVKSKAMLPKMLQYKPEIKQCKPYKPLWMFFIVFFHKGKSLVTCMACGNWLGQHELKCIVFFFLDIELIMSLSQDHNLNELRFREKGARALNVNVWYVRAFVFSRLNHKIITKWSDEKRWQSEWGQITYL